MESELDDVQYPVIVTVSVVRMMKASLDKIVGVVAVRDRLVAASVVAASAVKRDARIWILVSDRDHAFVEVTFVPRVEMAVVQVIDVVPVLNPRVPARLVVYMRMVFVNRMFHCFNSKLKESCYRNARGSYGNIIDPTVFRFNCRIRPMIPRDQPFV